MAIEYGFELGAPATADDVAGVLAHTAAAHGLTEAPGARFDGEGTRLRSGVLVLASASTALPFPDPVEAEFGFAPAVHVLFRFDKFTDPAAQREDMTRLVTALLASVAADAVLMFEGEIVWLLRRNGQLTISERGDFWTPELAALLPQHDRASLPSL